MLRSFETWGTTRRMTQRYVTENLYYQSLLSEFQILQVLLKLKRRHNCPQLTFATQRYGHTRF